MDDEDARMFMKVWSAREEERRRGWFRAKALKYKNVIVFYIIFVIARVVVGRQLYIHHSSPVRFLVHAVFGQTPILTQTSRKLAASDDKSIGTYGSNTASH